MESMDFYRAIERVLPEGGSIQVVASLRQDPLVWQSLQAPDFLNTAMEGAGNQPACWSPGHLALLTFTDIRPETLRTEPLVPLEHSLQEKALRAYQSVQRNLQAPSTLSEAGLFALALRERRRLTGTWSGLLQEIFPRSAQLDTLYPVWRTALACLYAFVPDPVDMLRGLLPKTIQPAVMNWIINAELSQPFSLDEHASVFTQVLKGLAVPFQLAAMRCLSLRGSEPLAASVAGRLLVGHPSFNNLRVQSSASEKDLASLSSRALSLHQLGSFYQLSGDHAQALSLFDAAATAVQQWLAGLFLQSMNLRTGESKGDTGTLMQSAQISQVAAAASWLQDDLGAVLVSHPYASCIIDQITEGQENAFISLKRAQVVSETEPALARDLAQQAAQAVMEQVLQHGMPFEGEYILSWRPVDAIQILLGLGLIEDALQLNKAMIGARPADLELLHQAAAILTQLGLADQALGYEYSAVVLDPKNPTWRRALAGIWGISGNWTRSFEEWKTVLTLTSQPGIRDRLDCAQAALAAGELHDALAMSEAILNEDPNNGAALGVLGQSLIGQGEYQQAAGYLVRATLLNPESLAPWLALAKLHRDLGDLQHALETLRAAVTALPDAPEAHLELGKACNEAGLLAEGLPNFKKAYLLSPKDDQTVLYYSQALRRLGYTTEAKAVLESVRDSWVEKPFLGYEYAQVLLDQNDPETALPVLEQALRNGLPVLEGHLLYAKVLLRDIESENEFRPQSSLEDPDSLTSRMQQAEQVLQRILRSDPNNLEARFLRADIMRERGNLEEALATYRQLADFLGPDTQNLSWRVQWGMARTALCLNRTDTALTAYREACQLKPDSLQLRRGLAEASLLASLPQEALEAADQVLQMASDDVNNLAWYAEFAARLGENEKAVQALERAVQIDPLRPDLLVDLAQWQMSAGDLPAARSTLETVCSMKQFREGYRGNFYRRSAQMYLRMQDPQSALRCYEQALAYEPSADFSLYFEVAELHERMGSLDCALDLAQKAQEANSESLPVFMLQADLLAKLNRPQAAMAVLERALRVIHGEEAGSRELSRQQQDQLGEIHERFTRLMVQEENIPAALYHAEHSLTMQPGKAALAYLAADLALSILQVERAGRIIASMIPDDGTFAQAMLEQGSDGVNLLCLAVETGISNGKQEEAQVWLDSALELIPQAPRLMASKVRLLGYQGDYPAAVVLYEKLSQILKQNYPVEFAAHPTWLVEAALEARSWEDALAYAAGYAAAHPNEVRAALLHARTLVKSAEHQRLCSEVGCTSKAPGDMVLDEEHQNIFNATIEHVSKLVNAGEIGRWQARGQAAYIPSAQTGRVLATMPSDADDVAALIAVLRQLNNRSAAMQVSRRYPQDRSVLLQLALCYLFDDSLEGLAVAEQAVEAAPQDCMAHVAMARLAVQASATNRAIEAYEKAIALQPGEPVWHDSIGDLYIQIGNIETALWHRQRAVELAPGYARYAYKLGQVSLASGDLTGAVEYLERSTALDAQQAEPWLALASAYHMSGKLAEAMEAAKQAGALSPSSAEGLLIAGETALAMNQIDQALELARNAVRREPENASAYLFLCSVLSLQGKETESLAILESASAQVKQVYPVAIERARLIYKVHGAQQALEVLEKLVKEYPEEPGLISLIARTEAECGDAKAAERYAFKALKLDPNQPDLTMMLGRIQRKSGQLDEAVHLMSEVIRMAPDSLEAYLELASVYQERREFILALQVYRQAMRIAPNDFQAYYQSGLILRDSKDYSSAEAMLRKAAELAPDNLSIRRQLVGIIALNLVHHKQEVPLP